MSNSVIEAILFDLDGTLVDLEPRYVDAFRESIYESKPDITDEEIHYAFSILLTVLGQKGFLLIPRTIWKVSRKGLKLSVIKSFKFMLLARRKYEAKRHTWILMKGAKETIQFAKENFKIGIVTSAFKDELETAISKLPILSEFDTIVGWEDVKKPKPDKEPVVTAAERLGVPPENCIMVGDLPTDVLAAKAAGASTVAYAGTFSEYTLAHLQKHNPDVIVENQIELRTYLKDFVQQ